MAFSTETIGQLLASGRHYVSTTVGFIGGVGIMSAAQSKGLVDATGQIFEGLKMVVEGATSAGSILMVAFPLIGAVMAKIASRSASLPSQAQALKAAAQDPNTPVPVEAQKSMIEATATIAQEAKDSADAKEVKAVILQAAAELPEVTKPIEVADPELAAAVPAPNVVAAR